MQLTTNQAEFLTRLSPFNSEYFERERVKTPLSEEICAFGYREILEQTNERTKYGDWMKIEEAKVIMELSEYTKKLIDLLKRVKPAMNQKETGKLYQDITELLY